MSHETELTDPARVVLRRRIEWMDTDAAAIYHWTTGFRLAEAAEAALHTALGIADFTFGATPRVAVQASFSRSLRFNDSVQVALAVTALGRTSVEYGLVITHDRSLIAEGTVKSCLIDRQTGRAIPWPNEIRKQFSAGGIQQPPD